MRCGAGMGGLWCRRIKIAETGTLHPIAAVKTAKVMKTHLHVCSLGDIVIRTCHVERYRYGNGKDDYETYDQACFHLNNSLSGFPRLAFLSRSWPDSYFF